MLFFEGSPGGRVRPPEYFIQKGRNPKATPRFYKSARAEITKQEKPDLD
jgi:hypothetical protein